MIPVSGLILIGFGFFLLKYSKRIIKTEVEKANITAKNLGDVPLFGSVFRLNKLFVKQSAPIKYKLLPFVCILSGLLILYIWLD